MNFQMTEEQGAIVEMASRLFADLCNDEAIQRFWSGGAAYDQTTCPLYTSPSPRDS